MARVWFCGFETGGKSELGGTPQGTSVVQGTTVRTGAYAIKLQGGSYVETVTGLNLSTFFFRGYVNPDGSPSAQSYLFGVASSSDSDIITVHLNTDRTLTAINRSSGTVTLGTGTAVIPTNTWTLFEVKVVISAGSGIVEIKIGGSIDQTYTGLTNNAKGNIDRAELENTKAGSGDPGINVYFDDCAIDNAAYCGAANIIARQIKAGTPTYDTWSKTSSQTIDQVWSETPFSATNSANSGSISTALAQTGLTASFSSTQTGHGSETIGASDTINAVKVGAVAKTSATTSSGGLGAVRQRLNGSDTDANVTITTSDAYYEGAIFTDTLTNINASEIGWNKRASSAARTHTVEDVWMQVEYTPAPPGAGFFSRYYYDMAGLH